MALNPNFVIASGLDEYFVDKDTGLPLAGGTLSFFIDSNRSVPKNVYTLSGSPPNYSYISLGNVITLNSTGNPSDDMGNNIVIYYNPYDSDGNVELYYVEVAGSDSSPQFTREAWPNIIADTPVSASDNVINYIPNGQFLSHENILASSLNNMTPGQISGPVTQIAQGGWTFQRPDTSAATDVVSFFRFGSYVLNPSFSPRYAVQVQCLSGDATDAYKDVRIRFKDVNKFASNTQQYTFSFGAVTVASSNILVKAILIKNFGTGGSTPTQTQINTVPLVVTSTQTQFQFSFIFGDNTGKSIGTLDDDYIEIAIRMPTPVTFGIQLTDFVLTIGAVSLGTFPPQTDRDFLARSLVAPVPDPNGFNLGLPLILTNDGLGYDDSQVGKIYATSSATPAFGELLCDGTSYQTNIPTNGIPNARLQQKLVNFGSAANPWNMPLFGTGNQFVNTISYSTATNALMFSTNQVGTQTATADGGVGTGFAFTTAILGNPSISTYGFSSFVYGSGSSLWVMCNSDGIVPFTVNQGTTSFTMNTVVASSTPTNTLNPNIGERIGTAVSQQLMSITVTALPAASQQFRIATPTTAFYVWFKVDGAGTDPAIGSATGILVSITSDMTTSDCAYTIANALSGLQVSIVKTVVGSALPANSYFTFFANSKKYYVWYSLNGSGTDPHVSSAISIPVSYTVSDSANTIRNNTIIAMNNTYFGVPNLAGLTIKGWDATGAVDQNSMLRYYTNQLGGPTVNLPNFIGSQQFDVVLNHQHDLLNYTGGSGPVANFTATNNLTAATNIRAIVLPSGPGQNDVKNIYMNYVIKY